MRRGFLNNPTEKKKVIVQAPQNLTVSDAADEDHPTTLSAPQDGQPSSSSFNSGRYIEMLKQTNNKPTGIIVTLPPSPDAPGPIGRTTQCLVWPGFEKAVLSQRGFPKPIKKPLEVLYRLGHIDDTKGMGMIATRDIIAGEIIVSERPLLIAAMGTIFWIQMDKLADKLTTMSVTEDITKAAVMKAMSPQLEPRIRIALERMTPSDQEAFQALANSHRHDGSEPLHGVMRTNALGISGKLHDIMPGISRDEDHEVSATCEIISRVNHSCSPNTSRYFYTDSFSVTLRASRNIPAGEEITLTYCDEFLPAAERQKALAPYGFVCKCPACRSPVESDKRRLIIKNIPPMEEGYGLGHWIDNPSLPDNLIIRQAKEYTDMIEKEGLESFWVYRDLLLQLQLAYAALGNAKKHSKYTKKALNAFLACGVPESEFMEGLLRPMVTNPAANGMWQKRIKVNV